MHLGVLNAVFACFVAGAFAAEPMPFGRVLSLRGDALRQGVKIAASDSQKMAINEGEEIETGSNGVVEVELSSGTLLQLGPNSRAHFFAKADMDVPVLSGKPKKDMDIPVLSRTAKADMDIPVLSGRPKKDMDIPVLSRTAKADMDVPVLSGRPKKDMDIPVLSRTAKADMDVPVLSGRPKKDMDLPVLTRTAKADMDVPVLSGRSGVDIDIPVLSHGQKKNSDVLVLSRGHIRVTGERVASNNFHLILVTPTAVAGMVGTDFEMIVNDSTKRTSLVTFKGSVNLAGREGGRSSLSDLTGRLKDNKRSVEVRPGLFSTISAGQKVPLTPIRIAPSQLHSLEKANLASRVTKQSDKQSDRAGTVQLASMTPVPPGINPKLVSVSPEEMQARINQSLVPSDSGADRSALAVSRVAEAISEPSAKQSTLPAGGFVDMRTGVYVAPPPGSAFDPITQVYVPPPNLGRVDLKSGEFHPATGTSERIVASQSFNAQAEKGTSMTASPLPPGSDPADVLARPGASAPPVDQAPVTVSRPTARNPAAVSPDNPAKSAASAFNPTQCPPYCNPLGTPGNKTGNQSTEVTLVIR
ncbi:MAG: FecR domain-containing protein [Deltaproteobacteria bacterium]|nr:FecR domain-containing protein [Deltaproteobacteria bacterium]